MKRVSTPLRNLRRARTINQANLASILHVSQQTLSKYERGVLTPSADMQELIAAVLGGSRAELFPEPTQAVSA